MLGGRICHWLLLFQESDFEVIIKLGKQNVGPNHLSCIPSGEGGGSLYDALLDVHLFQINVVVDQFAYIVTYLITSHVPEDWTIAQKKQLVMRATDYQLIVG